MAKKINPEIKTPYVLRLHEAPSTNEHWHVTGKLDEHHITTIIDPAVAHHSIPVTSIPSPFARMHLVEDAFMKINSGASSNSNALIGNTIYHKLVSEVFDIAELFFNYDEFKNSGVELDILQWKAIDKLEELKRGSEGHKLLGETLELFIKQSPVGSGLKNLETIFILRVGYKPIGGTSPSTMFYSTPNEKNFKIHPPIKLGQDTLFDDIFCPLYKRSDSFIKYLYLLFEASPDLKVKMPLFWNHLEINLKALENVNRELWNEINIIQHNDKNQAYSKLQSDYIPAIFAGPGTFINIIPGVMLYKKQIGQEIAESDFVIGSYKYPNIENEKCKTDKKPLLLQNQFYMSLTYFNRGKWDPNTSVPYLVRETLENRQLPGLPSRYPFLTVSDFLEPYLLRLPYKINGTRFFNGNLHGFNPGNKSENVPPDSNFALPLTKRFFDYFDVEDLKRNTSSGEPVFKMIKEDDYTVCVELRLPIKANGIYITFQRKYRYGVSPKIDQNNNDGAIVDCTFNLGIMPFLRNVKNQRVAVIERETSRPEPYQISFYDQNKQDVLNVEFNKTRSSISKGHQATSSYYKIDDNFDFIQINKSDFRGIIIPLFLNNVEGSRNFTFSIDFGTTSTHIEYSVDGSVSQSFNITESDLQLVTMNDQNWDITPREIQSYYLYEMIPRVIGNGEFKFPTRTALAIANDISWGAGVMDYGDFNPAFYYEKYRKLSQTKIETNLKWGNMKAGDIEAEGKIKGYLESLITLMRNKVLLDSGRLLNTKIIWFYPSSMSHFNKAELSNIWNNLVELYFGVQHLNVKDYSESVAPYYVHARSNPSTKPSLMIDIGGGTTDVCVFIDETPKFYTSFKFAGNTLFGNGYLGEVGINNGFAKAFSPIVKNYLDENYHKLIPLSEVYNELSDSAVGKSTDLISFFFSLENSPFLKTHHLEFSFAKNLRQNPDFKIAFLLFHGAILYHTAKWMKSQDLVMPQHIFYSGNGSKTINLLDGSPNWKLFNILGSVVFEKVYNEKFTEKKLELHTIQNPKEATCKGGIEMVNRNIDLQNTLKTVFLGNKSDIISEDTSDTKYKRIFYKDIQPDSEIIKDVLYECNQFIDFILGLNDFMKLAEFGIPLGKIELYRSSLLSSLDGFLLQGLRERMETTDSAQVVEETLFFYPIIGAIHKLTLEIAEGKI